MSERLFGPLQVRHVLYIMLAIVVGWRGLSTGSSNAVALAVAIAFVGLLSAVAGVRSMGFEAKVVLTLLSLFDSLFSSEPKLPKGSGKNGSRNGKEKSIRRAWGKLLAEEATVVLALVAPLAGYAMYTALVSGLSVAVKLVVISASALLIAIPIVFGRGRLTKGSGNKGE